MLELINFQKSYNNIPAIDIPAFTIQKGIYLLKGKNGSGKTTLFKALAGLSTYKGELRLNNTSLKQNPLLQRSMINYSEAEPKFPPFITGMDFIKLFAILKKSSGRQVETIVGQLKLAAYVDNAIGTYSSGMLKKFAIALAFIGNPALILLDEPFANVDDESITPIADLIISVSKNTGATIIITNHQDFAVDFLSFDSQILLQAKTLTYSK